MSVVLSPYVVDTIFQKEAKRLKRNKVVSKLSDAYDQIASNNGFHSWRHLKKLYKYEQSIKYSEFSILPEHCLNNPHIEGYEPFAALNDAFSKETQRLYVLHLKKYGVSWFLRIPVDPATDSGHSAISVPVTRSVSFQ